MEEYNKKDLGGSEQRIKDPTSKHMREILLLFAAPQHLVHKGILLRYLEFSLLAIRSGVRPNHLFPDASRKQDMMASWL